MKPKLDVSDFADECLYCQKKLRTKNQKRYGYCNQWEALLHINMKVDRLTEKLAADEEEFAQTKFELDPDLRNLYRELDTEEKSITNYLETLKEELS